MNRHHFTPLLYIIIVSLLISIGCSDNDSGLNPVIRDSVYTQALVSEIWYTNNAPFLIDFAIPAQSHIFLSIRNCYGDTLYVLEDRQMEAGIHRVEWCPDDTLTDDIYAININVNSSEEESVRVIRLRTFIITEEMQEFASEHYNYNIYEEYEYYAALYSDISCDAYGGSMVEWLTSTWEEKKPYLPDFFTHNLDPQDTDHYYSYIAYHTQQFGGAWDDATDFEVQPDDFEGWTGDSDFLDEYRLLFTY